LVSSDSSVILSQCKLLDINLMLHKVDGSLCRLNICPSSLNGSVSGRASKYSWLAGGRDCSCGFQHDRCGAAKEMEPAVGGGDLLIGLGAGAQAFTISDSLRKPLSFNIGWAIRARVSASTRSGERQPSS
jgi:hypothetical protein